MTQGSARFLRQTALPGWGPKTQGKLEATEVRVTGNNPDARSCREYLGRAGLGLGGIPDIEIQFEKGQPQAPRVLRVGGDSMGFWSKSEGPCMDCLSKFLVAEARDWGILRGALAADAVLTVLAGLSEWKAGRLIRLGEDLATREAKAEATKGCPDCR